MSILPPDRPVSNRILGWLAIVLVAFTATYLAGGRALAWYLR